MSPDRTGAHTGTVRKATRTPAAEAGIERKRARQSGELATPEAVDLWSERLRGDLTSALDGLVAAGHTLKACRLALGRTGYVEVLERARMSEGTASRLCKVGGFVESVSHRERAYLPASWGTLYELALLPVPVRLAALKAGTISPEMTRADATRLRPRKPDPFAWLEESAKASLTAKRAKEDPDYKARQKVQKLLDKAKDPAATAPEAATYLSKAASIIGGQASRLLAPRRHGRLRHVPLAFTRAAEIVGDAADALAVEAENAAKVGAAPAITRAEADIMAHALRPLLDALHAIEDRVQAAARRGDQAEEEAGAA